MLAASDGTEIRAVLLNNGLKINHNMGRKLPAYLQSQHPRQRVIAASNLGWHDRVFLFPDTAVPDGANVVYQSETRIEHRYFVRGDLQGWREGVGRRCAGNSRLVFGASAGFAGPLLRPLGVEGGGIHLTGVSSSGKSTTQCVAGSVCGGGRDGQPFKRTWRSTQNAIEIIAAGHNDGLLLLDEIREMSDPRELDATVYMLANGAGKGRATKSITERPGLEWRLLFLSTGEIKLSEHAATAGTKVKAGAEVRLANIPADAGAGMGLFEELHGSANPRIFAEELQRIASQQYGTPLRAFIERFIQNFDENVDWLKNFMAEFEKNALPPGAAPEVGRALKRFSVVAAAGALATKFGITGWDADESRRAALRCFQDWLSDRGGIGQFDIEAGIRQVRLFLETHGSSRFQSVLERMSSGGDVIEERIPYRAGFWKNEEEERLYLIFPEVWKCEVCAGFDAQLIATILAKRGFLKKGDGKNLAKREHTPIGRPRFYVISSRLLEEIEE
jgi:putative DNA primase/helicase